MNRLIPIVLLLLIISPVTYTQETDDTCSTVIEAALQMTQESCNGLERNQACYGNNRVDVTFWEEQSESVFSTPSDRVPLLDLQSIATSPLNIDPEAWGVAVLNLQTNLPDGLPGQAVTFMLMGDSSIENEVEPILPVEPIPAIVNANANIRSQPTINANVVSTAAVGDEVMLVGVNEAGDWYEIELETGTAWIWAELVGAGDVTGLPVTDTAPRYAPMQAFYFRSGVGDLQCNEAPNALIIQNPSGEAVQLKVNDLNVTIGSTIVVFIAEIENENVIVWSLIEGTVQLDFDNIILNDAGETVAITLNEDLQVDNNSKKVDFDSDTFADIIQTACENASNTGIFHGEALQGCDVEIVGADDDTPADDNQTTIISIPDDGACTVVATNTINLRGGPGTNYNREGQLSAAEFANPDGKATGADGYLWWRLDNGSWVRSDLVDMGGDCEGIGVVDAPSAPTASPVTSSQPSGHFYWIHPRVCEPVAEGRTLSAGESIMFSSGCCGASTVEEQEALQAAAGTPWLTLDGTPLNGYMRGIFWTGSWYSNDILYEWTATPGTHTIAGGWGSNGSSCTFTVSD